MTGLLIGRPRLASVARDEAALGAGSDSGQSQVSGERPPLTGELRRTGSPGRTGVRTLLQEQPGEVTCDAGFVPDLATSSESAQTDGRTGTQSRHKITADY